VLFVQVCLEIKQAMRVTVPGQRLYPHLATKSYHLNITFVGASGKDSYWDRQ